VSDHHDLRRNLRDALPTGPGFPSEPLLDRIMTDVSGARRGGRRRRLARLAPVAALLALLVVVGLLDAPVSASVGRVEFTGSLGTVEFLSSQAQPANEFEAMNDHVLAGFNGTPDFNSQPTAAQDVQRILYERAAGRSTVDLVALTQSDMAALQAKGALEDLAPLLRQLRDDRRFPQALLDDGRFGTGQQYAIPWLQATYLMVVDRRALPYLPPGADVHHLTYDQLVAWGQNLRAGTGQNRIGLPADVSGPQGGLVFRFLQGYTYPSYTGATLTGFDSRDAVAMWEMLRRLWAVTNPSSATYTRMDAPLIAGDVWVAWDHQARLAGALADSRRFLAVPAPSGPRGQGYMSALVDLAIPRGAPNRKGAEALIDWLTRPTQQAEAAAGLSFFPVVQGVELAGPREPELAVDRAYRANRRGIETLPPVGLGAGTDAFTGIYQGTFARIVLRGEDIDTVLGEEAPRLQDLVDEAGAPCWRPDPPGPGPCRIR
jgi:multiple sugar transport system substrate-binding protein